MVGVSVGEGLDRHPAQSSDGVQHAVAFEDEADVAIPRAFLGIQPDHQIAAPGVTRRDGLSELRLLVRIARGRAAAGLEGLLHQTAAVRAQR